MNHYRLNMENYKLDMETYTTPIYVTKCRDIIINIYNFLYAY